MPINPNIFKAYDIRGIYGQDLDDGTAYRLGRAYVELRRAESEQNSFTFVVARDMRTSSPQLKAALIKGLTEGGANVVDIDLASTPTFYFAVANYNYDGGIMVSASHNPKEYNGFKLVRPKAVPISGNTGMMILRDKVIANNFSESKKIGAVTAKGDVLIEQVKQNLKFADLNRIKKLKVVADTANGMGAQYLEALFAELPCELIKMNFELDGSFPNHEADPLKDENNLELQKLVVAEKADLGIAVDGDGDRIFFIDDTGKTIEPSIIRGILAQIFLRDKPGAKIAYDIRPGKITPDMITEAGGIPIITPVGHSLIKEIALKESAYFAGESSGHFFLNLPIGCFEMPLIMILKLLVEFSQSGKSVSEYIKPLKKYSHSGEINSTVVDKNLVFAQLKKKYKDAKINELDGVTITYPDFWFNVRGSNTEPKIRLNLEATSKKLMEDKRDEVLKIIRG